MGIKELIEKRAALLAEAQKPETTAERFAEIRSEVERLNFTIEEMQKAAESEQREEELRAARKPNGKPADGTVFDQNKTDAETRKAAEIEAIETRAKDLKAGKHASVEHRAVSSTQTPLSVLASGEINPAFEQVGTLDRLVKNVHLENANAESYKAPFAKTIGEGGITSEGAAATSAEPTFGYATINKIKIAYPAVPSFRIRFVSSTRISNRLKKNNV